MVSEFTSQNSLACVFPARLGRSLRVHGTSHVPISILQPCVSRSDISVRYHGPRNRILTPLSAFVRIHRTRLMPAGILRHDVDLETVANRTAPTKGLSKKSPGEKSKLVSYFSRGNDRSPQFPAKRSLTFQQAKRRAIPQDHRYMLRTPFGSFFLARHSPNGLVTHCNNSAARNGKNFCSGIFLKRPVLGAMISTSMLEHSTLVLRILGLKLARWNMTRHVLTTEERLRGVRNGIRALKRKRSGPKWLIPSMKEQERKLLERLKRENPPEAT
jgi:hypothetical protein